MNETQMFSRTVNAIGAENAEKVKNASVLVFGVGGVGGFACEALARSGIGRIGIVDRETVDISNINRQIIADTTTLGMSKVEVMKRRIEAINPFCTVEAYDMFYLPETADAVDLTKYNAVADAVDTVTAKIEIASRAYKDGVFLISCMGTGYRFDASHLRVGDIYETSVCPLAKVMRHELRKRKIPSLRVVWSDEIPTPPADGTTGRQPPASMIFVPASAGLRMAHECVASIIGR